MPNQTATTVPPYNYCLIPNFGNRYYFIRDWSHNEGVWEAQLEGDPLASFKTEIGEQDLYIKRASNESDGTIIDTAYPATTTITAQQSLANKYMMSTSKIEATEVFNLYDKQFHTGCIVFGIYGPNGSFTNTGTTWWVCSVSEFAKVAQKLMDYNITDSGLWETATVELPEDYAKAIADPIQYFAGIYWFPFGQEYITNEVPITSVGPTKFGYYNIVDLDFRARQILPDEDNPTIRTTMAISPHPQAATRGVFLNGAPYSRYHLFFPPFGEFDLDAGLLRDSTTIIATMKIDLCTGNARLDILSGTGLKYLGTWNGQMGVPISLTQMTYNPRGVVQGATQFVEGVASVAKSALMGGSNDSFAETKARFAGIYEGGKKAVGGIADAIEAAQPSVSNTGSNGSFLDFMSNRWPTVYSFHKLVVDEDLANLGRPLCKIRKPKDLGGYMICDGSHTVTIGTAEETLAINRFLQGGFYYE